MQLELKEIRKYFKGGRNILLFKDLTVTLSSERLNWKIA